MIDTVNWKAYSPPKLTAPAAVAAVELTDDDWALSFGEQSICARLLVRVHGRPVGYADISLAESRTLRRGDVLAALDPPAVERAAAHLVADLVAAGVSIADCQMDLARLLDRASVGEAPCAAVREAAEPLVTVAICTRNRAHSVGATLESLLCQTYRNFEIVLVDNAPSDDSTERLIRTSFPSIRYVRESRAGLDWARNRAVLESRGEILAYIDDDAVADATWLRSLVAAFDAPEIMCVTGMVAPARLDTPAQELFERFGYSKSFYRVDFSLGAPPPVDLFPYKGYHGTGCNSAFRRSVFACIGLFDPRLDMGTPVPGGGDHDMFTRVLLAGFTLRYEPDAIVFHDHIDDMSILARKLGQYQQAFVAYLIKCALNDRRRARALIADVAWSIVRKFARGLAAVAVKRDRPLALVLCQAYYPLLAPLALYRSHRQLNAGTDVELQRLVGILAVDFGGSAVRGDSSLRVDVRMSKD